MAAGKGSRMGTSVPKVLLPLCGRPIVMHVLDTLEKAGIADPVIVVGRDSTAIRAALGERRYVVQEEQLGSGDAVRCAREAASGAEHIIVMCGDSPLFRTETVRRLMETHLREAAAVSLTSAVLEDPHGYGRVLRGPTGEVVGIIEEKMATEEQKAIKEINGGCYAFDASWLWQNIDQMHLNEAGEYCLTEMVDIAIAQGKKIATIETRPDEVAGVNTPDQLHAAEEILRRRSDGAVE